MPRRRVPHICRDPRCAVHGEMRQVPEGWIARCTTAPQRFRLTRKRGGSFRGVRRER